MLTANAFRAATRARTRRARARGAPALDAAPKTAPDDRSESAAFFPDRRR